MRITASSFLSLLFILSALSGCKKNEEDLKLVKPGVDPITSVSGTTWTDVSPSAPFNSYISCLYVFNGNLWLGGNFTNIGSSQTEGTAEYNSTSNSFTTHYQGTIGGLGFSVLYNYNGSLLGGGGFYESFGTQFCSKWNGSAWSGTLYNINSNVYAITAYNNGADVVVGGYFTTYNSTAYNHVAMHNGSSYQTMGNGFNNVVNCLMVYNGELYAGGTFTMSGTTTVNHIAKWNGSQWMPLGSGTDGAVEVMEIYAGELYVGGNFTTAGGNSSRYIARWNGSSWNTVGGGISGGFNGVMALTSAGNSLYVGGDFTSTGTSTTANIAKWDGSTWSNAGNGLAGTYVYCLCNYNNRVYAGTRNSSSPYNAFLMRLQ